MTHVVVSDYFNCPKCGKKSIGASVQILDFLVCTDCYYNKFEKELEPKIFDMVRQYFKYDPAAAEHGN